MNRLAITTSSGRRVSMLCEDEGSYFPHYTSSPSPLSCPPLSPDFRRPVASERSDSFCSTISSYSSNGPLTPLTPVISLPPLENLMSLDGYSKNFSSHDSVSSTASSPNLASRTPTTEEPSSPNGGSAPVKRLSRKYTCHCNKSFTTSGHLARHSRIHTGEKNYACPEASCGARFSRQDNCMQHYRTHQSGNANKRTARKKRLETTVIVADSPQPATMRQYFPDTPFAAENGLAALANVAISGYS